MLTNKNMDIVVLGGGTAGWITALYANKIFPEHRVSVIESSKIGILGAGEGATPQLISLLDFLEIPVSQLIKNTKTTIKNGIKFTNWSNSKYNYFYHIFNDNTHFSGQRFFNVTSGFNEPEIDFSYIHAFARNKNIDEYSFVSTISDLNLVPFKLEKQSYEKNIIEAFSQHGSWSIHFDARLLAEELKKVSIYRGINHIDTEINLINTDENGYVISLSGDNDKVIPCDFLFDCSGFHRQVIGKKYNTEWLSFSESLPAKKAIPFFLNVDEEIPPYTESIAMDYGWMWKIPLQHRYGCGYVFDSDFISYDDAKKEIDEKIGFEVQSPTTFNFNPGCYKKIWVKNVLAVGLSSGFIEPLEATSIWQLFRNLFEFFSNKNNILEKNENIKNFYNEKFVKETNEIVDFLYLHYVTNKKNTEFWVDFTKNNKKSNFIEHLLNKIDNKFLGFLDIPSDGLFSYESYIKVAFCNGLFDSNILKKYGNYSIHNDIIYNQISSIQQEKINCISHKNFIEIISQNS